MEIGIIINFKSLFPYEIPNIGKLLEGFEKNNLLAILFSINTELYLNSGENPNETDRALIDNLLLAVGENERTDFLLRYTRFVKERKQTSCIIFNQKVSLRFIQFVLLNTDLKNAKEFNEKVDYLNFLKAYLYFNQIEDDKFTSHLKVSAITETGHVNFYKWHWPLLIQQYEYSERKNPILQLILGTVSLFSLIEKPEYKLAIMDFIETNESKNFFEYTKFIIDHIINLKNENLNLYNRFLLKTTDEYSGKYFYDLITVDIEELQNERKLQTSFNGLKSKPLYKLNEYTYGVIDWNFFVKKAFDSLFFDLFSKTSIMNEFKNNYPNFKSKVIGELIEKKIFSPLVYFIFNSKHRVLNSDYSDKQIENISFPDYYVRDGNKIYLFEFKSNSFSGVVKDSPNYIDIKNEIDSKINQYKSVTNNKKSGCGQLFDQIKQLSKCPFEFDNFINSNIKCKNLKIYPILVVDDESFALPGVNHYLNGGFRDKIKELDLAFKVENITVITLEFLFSNILSLKDNANNLFKLIENYHKLIGNNNERHEKKSLPNSKEYYKIYQSFESYYSSKFPLKGKDNRFVASLFTIYSIQEIANKYLPKN
jgi:hypothetical protein